MIFSTQFLILAKRPYRETALLLDGISPDCGRLSLVLHGGQKLSEKSFPVADLFRELDVEFDDNERSTLHTATRAELAADFDGIADNPRNYALAGRIASFLLKNMQQVQTSLLRKKPCFMKHLFLTEGTVSSLK